MLRRVVKRVLRLSGLGPRKNARQIPVRWGSIRTLTPVARGFFDRGQPVDRYYIEAFLETNKSDIHGTVLEIGGPDYTNRFGGSRVVQSEVLNVDPQAKWTTIAGDLSTGRGMSSETFDCVILTQVLPFVYDVQASIVNVFRALRAGGVVLATVPGVSQIVHPEAEQFGDYWRFTTMSMAKLFGQVFGDKNVAVRSYGNVLAAISFLHNLAATELRSTELEYTDPDYAVTVAVRAVKAGRP